MGTYALFHASGLNLPSDVDDHTVFLATVYEKNRIPFKPDDVVGSLMNTIGGILGKSKNGGTKIFCTTMTCSTHVISAIKVLEVPLRRDASDTPNPSGITIKFALAAELRGDINADEIQATDAVNKATEMTSALNPSPQIAGLVDSTINTGNNVVTKVQTFENTWGVLLQRMQSFNQIVAGIVEVFGSRSFDTFSV